jgi:dienelactone hydrolase
MILKGRASPVIILDYVPRILDLYSISNWLWKPYYVAYCVFSMSYFFYHNGFNSTTSAKITSFLSALKTESPSTPIGVAGFCWGGWFAFELARDPNSPSDVFFTAHPSSLKLPTQAENLVKPMSVAVGTKDIALSSAQIATMEGAFKKNEDLKWEVKVYEGAEHGFSIRAEFGRDDENEVAVKQAHEAEDQAISWFVERFKEIR